MSPFVAVVLVLVTGGWWVRSLLTDEDRYVRSVAPLAGSRHFARLSGRSVDVALRYRFGWRRPSSRIGSRAAGHVTRWTMGTRPVARAWVPAHRTLHRHRPHDRRAAVAMVALATMGSAVGVAGAATRTAVTTRQRLRHLRAG